MEITLTIPTDYSAITLNKWLAFTNDIKNYEGDEEAITALMLHHLCGLDAGYLKGLSVESFNEIKGELAAFIGNTELPLQRFIQINGKEYGFEPNLSDMSYGAYLDITKYDTFTIDENWAKIMSILYRPVTKKQGEFYQIKPYDGVLRPEGFGEVPMDIHFGALFFLLGLSTDLLSVTLNSLKEMELAPNIKSILVKSGKDIPLLLNLQKGMLDDLMKSLRNL
jgi:hypothetical protein